MADELQIERTPRPLRALGWCLFTLIAVLFVLSTNTIVGDGGFPSVEYRLQFVDSAGEPVPGVSLEVFTQAGGRCYHYPVEDFIPGHPLVTDTDGRMIFRHWNRGLEYGIRTHRGLGSILYRDVGPPKYDCKFFVDRREVHRMQHEELLKDWLSLPQVERTRSRSEWSKREAIRLAKADESEQLRFFDCNGDGILDLEERVAKGYFWRMENRDESPALEKFYIVEHTIVLPPR